MPDRRRRTHEMGIRFECQQCGRCCVARRGHSYLYLTLSDRRRLAAHLGLSTLSFTKRYCRREEGEFHLTQREGRCLFLEDRRCTVYEARPTQCRTWPFWRENMDPEVWNKEVVGYCPGVGKGKLYSVQAVVDMLAEESDSQPDRARSLALDLLMSGERR